MLVHQTEEKLQWWYIRQVKLNGGTSVLGKASVVVHQTGIASMVVHQTDVKLHWYIRQIKLNCGKSD